MGNGGVKEKTLCLILNCLFQSNLWEIKVDFGNKNITLRGEYIKYFTTVFGHLKVSYYAFQQGVL